MPATTPNLGLPYPVGGDPIDVAGDVQRLAEAIDGTPMGGDVVWVGNDAPVVPATELWWDADEPQSAAVVEDFVNVTGDAMTGRLTIGPTTTPSYTDMPLSIDTPTGKGTYIGLHEGGVRKGIVGLWPASASTISIVSDAGPVRLIGQAGLSFCAGLGGSQRAFITDTGTLNNYIDTAGQINQIMHRTIASADASGQTFVSFRGVSSAVRGTITHTGTGVAYNTTSDYRLKDDHGPITDSLTRVAELVPRRVVWKDDPDQTEMDGFFAHEVAAVVPQAVSGTMDAVVTDDDPEAGVRAGDIIPQQIETSRLIPLLTAAIQELTARVVALEGAP